MHYHAGRCAADLTITDPAATDPAATDLNTLLIRHPGATLLLRVCGDSMNGAGIHHGDLLIVDRALPPRPGHVVVALLERAFTLKRLVHRRGCWRLEAAHLAYPPIEFGTPGRGDGHGDGHGDGDTRIWGVAIHAIHPL